MQLLFTTLKCLIKRVCVCVCVGGGVGLGGLVYLLEAKIELLVIF